MAIIISSKAIISQKKRMLKFFLQNWELKNPILALLLLPILISSCFSSQENNMQNKLVNEEFNKKYGHYINDYKTQNNLVLPKKKKVITKINKVNLGEKTDFVNNMAFEVKLSPYQKFNEEYYPFVESSGYNGYIALESNFLDYQNKVQNPFIINYYDVNYGPFVPLYNPFDEIKIDESKENNNKYYPILPFANLRNNVFTLKNAKSDLDNKASLEIIAEKKNKN